MERMAARVYCAVLFCLAGCWSSTEAAPGLNFTANPGVCPGTRYGAEECTWIKFVSCADDSDCANNQKCCNNGCGLQCMDPVTEKPGVCPRINSDIRCIMKDVELCVGDSECPKNQKCCRTACGGTQCMAPVTAKPGVCPKTNGELIRCSEKDLELCVGDSECPKNQKCCGTACGGTRCTAPVTVKPGVCPKTNAELVLCIRKDDELCADDSECPKNQKCCGTPCGGTRCTAPVTVNPGVCPGTRYGPEECTWIKFVSCADDSECANNQKCCNNGCGLQCMAAVTDVCRLPMESGMCLAYMPMWGFDFAAGKCVSFIYGGCGGNDNRFNSKKECEESCMKSAKPGLCPTKKYKPAMCARIRFVPCADDSDCANKQKCCNNGCGLQCMDPVKVKPGVCPVRKPKPWICPLMNFMSCVDDSDCVNNEKCCSNGCGLDCMAPVTG